MLKYLFVCLLIFNLNYAFADDKQSKINYYTSNSFKQSVKQYCNFKTPLVSRVKLEAKSLDHARKVIAKIADMERKYSWYPEIDRSKSYLIYAGDSTLGMIYHYSYKGNLWSQLIGDSKEGYSDYYRDYFDKDRFRGCVLNSSSKIKNASFEYKIVQEKEKVYIERTAKVITKMSMPVSIAKLKLDHSNKESLEKALKAVKS